MKKHIAVIEKITLEVVCLEANEARDLFNWNDLDAFTKLPRETIEKLRRLDRQQDGYWQFADIKSEEEIIKNQPKEPSLPMFSVSVEFLNDETSRI
jgi:hypothetical protein